MLLFFSKKCSVTVLIPALVAVFFVTAQVAYGQTADNTGTILPKGEDKSDQPKSFRETLEKMRIQKEKKEYEEMIERGQEALKLTEELEKAYASTGRLDNSQLNKLAEVEKLVKKIRNELGGDDDDDDDDDEKNNSARATSLEKGDVIRSFRSNTVKLLEELKKTSRFTVSAAAIQTSNAVLKIVRLLRLSR